MLNLLRKLFGTDKPKPSPAPQSPVPVRPVSQPAKPPQQVARPAHANTPPPPEDEAERLFQKGKQLFAQDKFREAAQSLEKAAELNPKASQIPFTLAMTYGKIAAELANDGEKAPPWTNKARLSFQSALTHAATHGGLNDKQLALARESITEFEKLLGLDLRQETVARVGNLLGVNLQLLQQDIIPPPGQCPALDPNTLAGVMCQPWDGLLVRLVYLYFRSTGDAHTNDVYQSAIRSAEREISNAVIVQGVLGAGSQTTDAVAIVFPECSMRLTDWFSQFVSRDVTNGIAQQGGLVRLPIDWFGQTPERQLKTQQLAFSPTTFKAIGELVPPLLPTPLNA